MSAPAQPKGKSTAGASKTKPGLGGLAFELLGLAILVVVPMPIPRLVPLLLFATVAGSFRGLRFSDFGLDWQRGHLPIGLALGVFLAIVVHLAFGLEHSAILGLRGNRQMLIAGCLLVSAQAFATEMVFRGYLMHLVSSRFEGIALPILLSALLHAASLDPRTVLAAIGAGIFASGFALFYLAAGRRLLFPIAVHAGWLNTVVLLEYFS